MHAAMGLINNIPALVQIIAWCRSGDKPLYESMMVRLPTHMYVTGPQWVNCPSTTLWTRYANCGPVYSTMVMSLVYHGCELSWVVLLVSVTPCSCHTRLNFLGEGPERVPKQFTVKRAASPQFFLINFQWFSCCEVQIKLVFYWP